MICDILSDEIKDIFISEYSDMPELLTDFKFSFKYKIKRKRIIKF